MLPNPFKLVKKLKAKIQALENQQHIINQMAHSLDEMVDFLQKKSLSDLEIDTKVLPVQPKHLQLRVSGAYFANFFKQGNSLINDMESLLSTHGASFATSERILDFGCGCGRTLYPLSKRVAPKNIYGTDIDEEAIQWLNNNTNIFGGIDVNPFRPPMKYESDFFDLIFGISVFTHLPEDMQFEWLDELKRITKPGGYVLLTVHGEKHAQLLPAKQQKIIATEGFYYSSNQGIDTDGLPEFYQTTYHSQAYIKREWSKYFEVVEIKTKAINNNHDGVLLRKK